MSLSCRGHAKNCRLVANGHMTLGSLGGVCAVRVLPSLSRQTRQLCSRKSTKNSSSAVGSVAGGWGWPDTRTRGRPDWFVLGQVVCAAAQPRFSV